MIPDALLASFRELTVYTVYLLASDKIKLRMRIGTPDQISARSRH